MHPGKIPTYLIEKNSFRSIVLLVKISALWCGGGGRGDGGGVGYLILPFEVFWILTENLQVIKNSKNSLA